MMIHLVFGHCSHHFTKISVDAALLHITLIIGLRVKSIVDKGIEGDEEAVQKIRKGSRYISTRAI